MAEVLDELTQQVLACAVCLEPFSPEDKQARLLPCRHSFCLGCLQQLCQGNSLTCPICRHVAAVTGSVDDAFPVDLGIMNTVQFLHVKRISASIPCGECSKGSLATHRCQTCRSYLCAQCVQAHARLKALRNHSLLAVGDLLQSPQTYFSELELCPRHEDARLHLHCSSPHCCQAVCSNCALTSHQGEDHHIEDLQDVLQREKEDNRQLRAQLQERRAQLGEVQEAVTSAKAASLANKEDVLTAVREMFDTLHQAVSSRRQQVEEKLAQVSAGQVREHDRQLAAVGHSVAEVEASADYLARIAGWAQPVQFLALHRAQTSSVRQLLASSPVGPPGLHLGPGQLKLDTSGLQRVLHLLLSLADVTETSNTWAQTQDDLSQREGDLRDAPLTSDVATETRPRENVMTQTPEVMTQSTGTATPHVSTSEVKTQTERAGLRKAGTSDVAAQTQEELQASASSGLPRVQYTQFPLCGDCVNTARRQVSRYGDVITNIGGGTTQSDTPHTHPVCPSPHSPHPPSPSPPFLLTPSSSSPSPSPPSVSPPLPQFRRLRKYWGTLGRVVLETGQHYWEVEASFKGKEWGQGCCLSEMGLVSPGEQDSDYRIVGSTQSVWGMDVRDCRVHRCLCVTGWEGKKQVCHTRVGSLPAPGSLGQIRVGLLLDLEAGTLVCLDATRGVRLCTLHNVRPPLIPCFAVGPKSLKPHYDVSLRVVTGDRTAVDRGRLEQLRGEAGDSDSR